MPKIFRKIRRRLAQDNKLGKYIRYAMGEIALVVIGILIALSINNWNNSRITSNKSISLAERLLAEVIKNKKELRSHIDKVKKLQYETRSLLSLFGPNYKEMDGQLVDSLLFGFINTPLFEFNESTLREGLNTGQISTLASDSLRALLYDIPQIMIRIRNYEEELTRDIEYNLMPFLYEQISLRQVDERFSSELKHVGKSGLKAFDNRAILGMRKFENMVDNKLFLLETLQYGYAETLQTLLAIEHLLEDALE